MESERWFADRVAGLPDAPARMAALLEPLFAAGFGDNELVDRLRRAHETGGPPPVVADALGVLAARLAPERADMLAERCLGYAIGAPSADGGPGDGGPGPASRQEPAAPWLPGRWLPETVVGVLAWSAPVLLTVLVLVLLG